MNYLDTIKNITKNSKRKKENLILLLVLLVILLICINYIFSEDKNKSVETISKTNDEQENNDNNLEEKISEILNQISGITDASVIINYSDTGNNNIAYDIKQTLNDEGNVLSVEKSVAYNEESGKKTAIIQLYNTPTVEGVIIVASGVEGTDIKQKISTAIGNLLGVASYKVQVFEK
jgi:stage III sporulation protein AG